MPVLNHNYNLRRLRAFRRISAISAIAALSVWTSSAAKALECPLPHSTTTTAAIKESRQLIDDYSDLLVAQGDKAVSKIISSVRSKHPHASDAQITNFVVTIYCPVLQKNAALSEWEKRARLKRMSSKLLSSLAQ